MNKQNTYQSLSGSILVLIALFLWSCNSRNAYPDVYDLLQKKQYFKAEEIYASYKKQIPEKQQFIIEAILNNAFNNKIASQECIVNLLTAKEEISDSILQIIYQIKIDNELKLFNYRAAKKSLEVFMSRYSEKFSKEEIADYRNSLKIYTALENQPAQTIHKSASVVIKMKKDMAGLNTLPITTAKDSVSFVFDTGANLSVISQSTAEKLELKILPEQIEVSALTGKTVLANLGMCKQFFLKNIEFRNVVFLILKDEHLSFPSIDYSIKGIIGFPVIEALKEVHISKDGLLTVPKKESTFKKDRNIALDKLTPLVDINNQVYTFDTGAPTTTLYPAFYIANQSLIDSTYTEETIRLGGAGGELQYRGYYISHSISDFNRIVSLQKVPLLKDIHMECPNLIGNLGQDYLGHFDTLILNFNKMSIRLQ